MWAALPVSVKMPAYVVHREALAQLRHARGDQHAHVAYLAPSLEHGADEDLWMAALDALAEVAGERGATDIIAEVEEASSAVVVLRRCNFAIYARQMIWCRPPGNLPEAPSSLRRARAVDEFGIMALYCALVPGLMQQVEPSPIATDRQYILDDSDSIVGVVAACQGWQGTLIEVYLHPRAHDCATEVISGALLHLKAHENPIYCRVRRYEVWPSDALMRLGFAPIGEQVVMVRHTALRTPRRAVGTLPAMEERHAPLTTIVKQASSAQEGD